MPRARNIKYGFFENDKLADIEPIGRLLFIGLWTLADYKGDIEYRAKKIKAQLLPYDICDVESIMTNLDLSGFITIYNVAGVSYIHIDKFTKHQNPHPNEKKKGSDIPAYDEDNSQVIDYKEVAINHDLIVTKKDESVSDRADPLSLNPDIPIPDMPKPKDKNKDLFDSFWSQSSKRGNKKTAYNYFNKILNKKDSPEQFTDFLINDMKKRKDTSQMGFDQMHITTYLNGERFDDEIQSGESNGTNQFQPKRKESAIEGLYREQAAMDAKREASRNNGTVMDSDGSIISTQVYSGSGGAH
jgi:hypothetical protein